MIYKVEYKSSVSHDLQKLDKQTAKRLLSEAEEILSSEPYKGEKLRGEFSGLYKLRLGDYRVIYAIIRENVLILRIRHRGKAYE